MNHFPQVGPFACQRWRWYLLHEVVSSLCLYIPAHREEPVRNLANLCRAFLQASAAWGVRELWELDMGEECRDLHRKGYCGMRQASPSRSGLSPEANPADLSSELPGLLVQDRPQSSRREEGELLFVPCLPAWPGAGTSF